MFFSLLKESIADSVLVKLGYKSTVSLGMTAQQKLMTKSAIFDLHY